MRRFFYRKAKFHLFLWAFMLLAAFSCLLLHLSEASKEAPPEILSPDSPHRAPAGGGTKYIV